MTLKNKINFLEETYSYHLHILQLFTFFYCIYRLLSRDYAFYGFLPSEIMTFPRGYNAGFLFPTAKYTTFAFIYDYISFPSYEFIKFVQQTCLAGAVLGFIGIFPKIMATLNLLFFIHMKGIITGTNGEVEGAILLIVALFCIALTPKESLYGWKNLIFTDNTKSYKHGWTVKLFLLLVASYYTMAGINKFFDVGPFWAIQLNLENLAFSCQVDALSYSSRFMSPFICGFFHWPILSDISGVITVLGETLFFLILFKPKLSWIFVGIISVMHILVYYMAGINFLGSTIILFCCLNWNDIIVFLKNQKNIKST